MSSSKLFLFNDPMLHFSKQHAKMRDVAPYEKISKATTKICSKLLLTPESHALTLSGFQVTRVGAACMAGVILARGAGDGAPPPNLSPPGAGKRGAFRQAKRDSNISTSSRPDKQGKNVLRDGETAQPGRKYEFYKKTINNKNISKTLKTIRDNAHGHFFGKGNSQNRGPHFNGPKEGTHYDY